MDRIFKIRCSAIGKIMSNAKVKGELSAGCKTYLHEWYANDNEQIRSKYTDKGNMVELEAIEFMEKVLNLGLIEKNFYTKEDEYFKGTCDVNADKIYDIKAAWNRKTLLDHAIAGIDSDNEWQLRGYMRLYSKKEGVIFHALMDTPEEVNYGEEVTYSHFPDSDRWVGFKVTHDETLEKSIIDKVIKCREYLEEYHNSIINKLGKIN